MNRRSLILRVSEDTYQRFRQAATRANRSNAEHLDWLLTVAAGTVREVMAVGHGYERLSTSTDKAKASEPRPPIRVPERPAPKVSTIELLLPGKTRRQREIEAMRPVVVAREASNMSAADLMAEAGLGSGEMFGREPGPNKEERRTAAQILADTE